MNANFSPSPGGFTGAEARPIAPGKKSSGLLKGCLAAAGLFAIILVLALAVAGWYGYSHGSEWMAKAFELGKPEFMAALTPDHAPEQRAEMEKTYDQMIEAIREQGFIQLITKHEKSFRFMQAINADLKITPEESKLWREAWNQESAPAAPENQNPE